MFGRSRGAGVLIAAVTALCMGCFLVMRAFGAGGAAQFAASVSSGDPLEIVVTPGGASSPRLDDEALGAFKGIEGVEAATGVITMPLRIKIGSYEARSIGVTAVDPSALRGRCVFMSGGMLSPQSSALQIVLGYGAQIDFKNGSAPQTQNAFSGYGQDAAHTLPPVNWLGQSAQISFAGASQAGGTDGADASGTASRTYTGTVTGILKEDKSDRNGQVFMSLSAAQSMLRQNYDQAESLGLSPDSYATAEVFAKDINSVKAVVDAIARMGFSAQSDVADLDGLKEELSLQQTLLIVIEIFSILAAFLLTVCILLSVQARHAAYPMAGGTAGTRGAGLPGSAALGFAGGLASVLLALFFTLITNTSSTETVVFGMHFGQNSNLAIPYAAALEAVGISAVSTLFAGWITRRRA